MDIMKNNISKRLTVLLVTLAMLVSLLPTVMIQASAVGVTVTLSSATGNYFPGDSTYVDDSIAVNSDVDITGGSININGFVSGDTLTYTNTTNVSGSFSIATGILTISGTADAAEYQTFLRSVKFSSTSTSGSRTFEILLSNSGSSALYCSATGHFYEYVGPGATWSGAFSAAAGKTYSYGGTTYQGYLVTITSADENAFITQKLGNNAWIGASDSGSEGIWEWVAGPENNTTFSTGNAPSVTSVGYSNWNDGEPNDSGGEDYGEIYCTGDVEGCWNDLNGTGTDLGYVVEYSNAAGDAIVLGSSGSASKTITITQPTVTLSVNNSAIAENAGSSTVTATLSLASTQIVTVTLGYTGTATGSGTDYTASGTTITIPAGSTTGTVTITAVDDARNEFNETVIIDITAVTNGTENGTQQQTVTITDDDAVPTFRVNDPSVIEGNSGTAALTFTVTLSAASGKTVTVDYATADATATAGTDYTAISTTTLTFAPGDTSKTVSVTVAGDADAESNETILLNLSNPLNATVADAQGIGTITDDDTVWPVSSGKSAIVEVNGRPYSAGDAATGTNGSGQTVTTVTVDTVKLRAILDSQGRGAIVTIPVTSGAQVAAGVLTGQMVDLMEQNGATLVIQTDNATYTLPASEININAISGQLGENVSLSDITVTVSVSAPTDDMVTVIADAGIAGGYTLMVPAVEFTVSCTYGGRTVDVSTFNAYVDRTIVIPDGVDPNAITTAVVVDPDGTTHSVPTEIIFDSSTGRYCAVIHSLTNSAYAVIYNPVEFADVTGHWAKDAINDMGSRLVVTGVGDDNFEPERDITRAEFAAVVVRALGLAPGIGTNSFDDVYAGDWFCGYVETAVSYGIITGYDDGTFRPTEKITREQAMVMIARAMKITKLEPALSDIEITALLADFNDSDITSDYARQGVATCLSTGVVTGRNGGIIAPKDNITRAEVAVLAGRLLRKSGLI